MKDSKRKWRAVRAARRQCNQCSQPVSPGYTTCEVHRLGRAKRPSKQPGWKWAVYKAFRAGYLKGGVKEGVVEVTRRFGVSKSTAYRWLRPHRGKSRLRAEKLNVSDLGPEYEGYVKSLEKVEASGDEGRLGEEGGGGSAEEVSTRPDGVGV